MATKSAEVAKRAKYKRVDGQPRYQHLAAGLRRDIEKGILLPGSSLPSFREMYAVHGATPTTMNRVYALLEQDGFIVREPGRGTYVSNHRPTAASGTIGFMWHAETKGLSVPYWGQLISGAQEAASRHGAQVLIVNSNAPAAAREKVNGILSSTASVPTALQHLPCVVMVAPHDRLPTVTSNDYAGMKTATEHLLGLGHRRIAYLLISPSNSQAERRLAGFRAALWEGGIEPRSNWVRTVEPHAIRVPTAAPQGAAVGFDLLGYQFVSDWLQDDWKELGCTALLVWNDEAAIGAIKAFREAGLEVPRDVSVVGFDGTKTGEHFSPSLTSVEVPLHEIGERSVELLLQLIEGKTNERGHEESIVLPVHLRVGKSTAPIKVD